MPDAVPVTQRSSAPRDRVKELRRVRASELRANPKNWRRHPKAQSQALRRMVSEVGFASAVIAREDADGLLIIDGHLRQEISGDELVPVLVLDVNEREADMLLATMDPLAAMAQSDGEALKALLATIGPAHSDLDALMAQLGKYLPGTEVVDPEPGELPDVPTTVVGDCWVLGRHRLACGDSTDASVCAYAANGGVANSLVTDPPYGVAYFSAKGRRYARAEDAPIENDALAGQRLAELFVEFLRAVPLASVNTAYVFMASATVPALIASFEAARYTYSQQLIWVKNNQAFSRTDYKLRHEHIVYGWRGKHRYYGALNSTSVLEFDRPNQSKLHPTMKPVALLAKLIEDGTPPGGTVFDSFAGSGSTMMAAEQTGRACYCVEIDPRYCDVVVQRWQQLTGKTADRISARS